MLQSLLEERFKLMMRTETRDLPMYELTVARADRRLGRALQPSRPENCAAAPVAGTPAPPAALPACGFLSSPKGHWVGRGITLRAFMTPLAREAGRFVVDRTNLTGPFDVDLAWVDLGSMLQSGGTAPASLDLPASLNAALEEQLGLRLVPRRGPVPVSVIEGAERPDPD